MKILMTVIALMLVSGTASASDMCLQTAEEAAKAVAKINKSPARTIIDTLASDSGETVEVTLDNMRVGGGQSVTYTVTFLTDSGPCQVSKVEITGEE